MQIMRKKDTVRVREILIPALTLGMKRAKSIGLRGMVVVVVVGVGLGVGGSLGKMWEMVCGVGVFPRFSTMPTDPAMNVSSSP